MRISPRKRKQGEERVERGKFALESRNKREYVCEGEGDRQEADV